MEDNFTDNSKTEINKQVDFLEELLNKLLDKLMGECLDIMRMSIASDRAFKQMERTTRNNFNTSKRYIITVLKEKGYIK